MATIYSNYQERI